MTAVPHPRAGEFIIYGVHVTGHTPDGDATAGPIECLHSTDQGPNGAKECARSRSNDDEVYAAAVTSYVVDQPGTRRRVALFMNGKSQRRPYCTDEGMQWVRG